MELVTSLVSTSFYDDDAVTASSASISCNDPELIGDIMAIVDDINVVRVDDFSTMSDTEKYRATVEYVVNLIVAPLICSFGIVGNLLNLLVLTRKRLQCSMDRMEKSANVGMVALAVSDFMFCLFYLLTIVAPEKTAYLGGHHWLIGLYYSIYKEALVNVFGMTSTWLMVVMAIGRYVVVCRPLHARGYISLRGTRAAIGASFFISVLMNVPRLLKFEVITSSCSELVAISENCSCEYFTKFSNWHSYPRFKFIYDVVWLTIAILVPLAILTACNVCLIRALQQSRRLQRQCRANNPSSIGHGSSMVMSAVGSGAANSSCRIGNSAGGGGGSSSNSSSSHNRITPTLVALIIVFIVCVGPTAVIEFLQQVIVHGDGRSNSGYSAYLTAMVVTNCLFLINFAANFILYCVVNVQFRRTARDIIFCTWKTKAGPRGGGGGRGGNAARLVAGINRRGHGTLDCSIAQTGVTGGRVRTSLTYTVCTAIGSASCFDTACPQASSTDVDVRASVGVGGRVGAGGLPIEGAAATMPGAVAGAGVSVVTVGPCAVQANV